MIVIPKRYFDLGEYLIREQNSLEKHEFYKGEILPLAPFSFQQCVAASNIAFAAGNALRNGDCKFLGSNMRILVESSGFHTYADGLVLCGKPIIVKRLGDHLTNPKVIFEVLSPSTASYDRKEKFELYRAIASFEEYVLVDPHQYRVEVRTKRKNGRWTTAITEDREGAVTLKNVGIELAMKDIYD